MNASIAVIAGSVGGRSSASLQPAGRVKSSSVRIWIKRWDDLFERDMSGVTPRRGVLHSPGVLEAGGE
jgi:hypothetical protein